jgi:2-polyprenyl-6-methoxyphenol hydroxylase-like FAD-dependent oxidoreductase
MYDIITVGGGLGGSALAIAMARAGKRVLVLEGEESFRDRVRGEQIAAWGANEAKELGILDLLRSTCANEEVWFDFFFNGMQVQHRNLLETTPYQVPNLTFFHPEMQEALLREAGTAGADVRRGARVAGVEPGETPAVQVRRNGDSERIEARLVVGADGRSSTVRKLAGFEVERDPDRLQIGGIMMENCPLPADTAQIFFNPPLGIASPVFPQAKGRARVYLVTRVDQSPGHSGDKDLPAFLDGCKQAGVPESILNDGKFTGPLATFKGASTWVEHPHREGVLLVGDASGHSDPSWGQGLSHTLRDVRTLRDRLLETDDWSAAADAYAAEQQETFMVQRAVEDWFSTFFYDVGPEADERRGRAIPLIVQDGTRVPDHFQAGPECEPATDDVRKRFFAEE